MQAINISLNTAITTRLKSTIKHKGYNNVSEYIRDLLRRDLNLEYHDDYQYDEQYLRDLSKEAKEDVAAGRTVPLGSLKDLLS